MRHSRLTGLACFALPVLLFLAVCAAMGFAPFGSSSILIFDLSDQFVEFLCALKHGDVFFSWNTALGGSYIGTFSYYVSSPFSLLTLLCPDEHMPIAVVFLVALKLGLAGLTFSLLLRRRTGRYDLTTLAFSLCYALMAYNIAYAMSFMWLDGVLWLPVLLIGTEDLLDGKRPWLLLIGLVVSFVSTWYISYMTGIFCALYLLWRCICEGLSPVKPIARLAGWAGLALLLSSWLWLPTSMSMLDGKLANTSVPFTIGFNWPLSTLFYKLLVPGAYDSVTYTGSAFLYCSLPAVVLALLWFFRPGLSMRAKLATFGFGSFLLLCLWFAPLDRVWHLFQPPNSFPGRWSFVVSCFILLLGYDALLWLLDLVKHVRLSNVLPALLALVLAVDMSANALLLFRSLDRELEFENYNLYLHYKTDLQQLLHKIPSDEPFQRIASDVQRSRNEPAAFGYKGLTFFSSSYNAKVNRLLNDLGYAQDWFWSTSLGSTPVSDALLGVGWRISNRKLPDFYESVYDRLYRSFPAASPGYFTPTDLSAPIPWDNVNPFQYQNALLKLVSGIDTDVFTPLPIQYTQQGESGGAWLAPWDERPLFSYFSVTQEDAALYDRRWGYFPLSSETTPCIQYLAPLAVGIVTDAIELPILCEDPTNPPLVYAMNTDALNEALKTLSSRRLTVTTCSNGKLEGTVTATMNGWLFTSIPAIPGWTVKVDGEIVECGTFRDTLLTIPVPTGTHTVSMHYTPPGLIPGLALTGLGALLTAILLIRKRKQ